MIMNEKAINSCKSKELLPVLKRLKKLEKYCRLIDGNIGTYAKTHEITGNMPDQLKEWLKIFDGGILFTISMFSTRDREVGKFNRMLTFSEINSSDFREKNDIPEEVVCFAMTNYGNYYCYISYETSGCIYEFDTEQTALIKKWDSFSDWLNEQIDFAESLIADGELDPLED
ncbi:MAG: SMI1/KNR4 family protein [Clostridia bacterium]|nr:SMI1/KNR4 family protein [Clostridia bacterium]